MSRRKRFSERQVIETLIRQGVEMRCYRTKELITLETVNLLEREHLTQMALGGADTPANCAYSLKAAHAIVTNGTKATSYGSDAHARAKIRALTGVTGANKTKRKWASRPMESGKTNWPKRKMQSRGFQRRPAQ